jgi:O-antigen ligase
VRGARSEPFASRLAPLLTILVAIALTGSRSALLALLLVLVMTAARTNWRTGLLLLLFVATFAGGVFYMVISGMEVDAITRLATLSDPAEAFGERIPLLLAAAAMFRDYPIAGVGWGAFEPVYVAQYGFLIGEKDLTKSHTALLTMAAELGILGLGAMAFIMWLVVREAFRRTYRFSRSLSLALVAAILITFLSAQSEGRFWEDPMLWMLLGLLLANSPDARLRRDWSSAGKAARS